MVTISFFIVPIIIGEPIFVRRLTKSEVNNENALPRSTLLDPEGETVLTPSGNSQILVCSAACTHLGCIPVPYLGAYKGWVCLCHGSVYDKYGRVRQGKKEYFIEFYRTCLKELTIY